MKLDEKGFTLLELLVVTAIVVFVANAAALTTFQVLANSESNRNEMTAVTQARNAGYWVSLDAQRAQSVQAQGLGGSETSLVVSWKQSIGGYLESSDALHFSFSGDGGNSWSDEVTAFTGYGSTQPSSPFSYTIPDEYITDDFRVRYFLQSFDGTDYGWEYAYIDDIAVAEAVFSDDCSSFTNWTKGSDWSISSGKFGGHHTGDDANRYLTMQATQDLSFFQGKTVKVSWYHSEDGNLEADDALRFAFSSDNGTTWSSNFEAFHDDIGSTPISFSYPIPNQYLTNGFRMRLYLGSFSNSDDGYAYIDNVLISIPIWSDGCSSFTNWTNGSDWGFPSGQFRGHHTGDDANRYLTMNTSLGLVTQVYSGGFPLTFTWITWSEAGGTQHQVTYSIVDGRLMRSYSVGGSPPTVTKVAEYVDPYSTSCQFAHGKLTFTITTTVGGSRAGANETREFQVLTRPD
jgi:prepilin-type N-terminal cleavage/methylation domain-containing protein